MTKAKTLDDIYNNFEYNKPLSEDEYEFFVNIYDKKLKRFIGNVRRNENYQNIFFIAGQRGNGKSTILNNLKHKNSTSRDSYEIRHLHARGFLNYDNVEIIDILLMIGFDLLDNNTLKENGKSKLQDEFESQLKEIQNLDSNLLYENVNEPVSIKVKKSFISFFTAKSSFSDSYKLNSDIRKEAKKIFKFKTKDLLNILNDLIFKYKMLSNSEKDILLILDGLEKLNDIDNIVTENIDILRDIKCFKIITIPIHLKESINLYDVKAIDFTMEVDKNNELKNLNLLEEIITTRIDKNSNLITQEAIKLAVANSGGNIRQLLNIVQTAATEAMDIFETDSIDIEEIESAINILQGQLASKTQMYSKFLNQIKNTHTINNVEDKIILNETLQVGLVFAYFSGKVHYDINPIIKEILKNTDNENIKPIFIKQVKNVVKEEIPTIKSIEIKNFFSIKNLKLNNLENKKEIYILGENGDGKTLLLQAIAVALKGTQKDGQEKFREKKDKFNLNIIDSTEKIYNADERNMYKNFFAYGAHRNNNCKSKSDDIGYLTLFENDLILKDPVEWLKNLDHSEAKDEKNIITVSQAKQLIKDMLDKNVDIEINSTDVIFTEKGAPVEFERLSAGYKGVITIICDMLIRLSENQPYITNIKKYRGIVLIDEIELHLHPKWKYRFVKSLRDTFPYIQFIFTTHSPTVILGASSKAVFYKIYKEKGEVCISNQIENEGYTNNSLISSPLFDLKTITSRDFENKNISSDDYIYSKIHKVVALKIKNNININEDEILKLIDEELDKL